MSAKRYRYSVLLSVLFLILALLPGQILQAQEIDLDPAREWDGETRYTVLVVGMDRRPDEGDRLTRTDVVMVVSYVPQEPRLGILKLPRNLHFVLPDGSLEQLSSIVVLSELDDEGSGFATLVETVQLNLGMYIDAVVALDFDAFITLVDAIGGITINVETLINDRTFPDMNYRFDPLYLTPGTYDFDGYDALRYARTRHGDNEYVRGQRQLQVILAIRDKLQSPALLQNLVSGAPDLFEDLEDHIYTNLPPEQAVLLGLSMMQLGDDDLYTAAIDETTSFITLSGTESVLIPDRELLPDILTGVFGETYNQ